LFQDIKLALRQIAKGRNYTPYALLTSALMVALVGIVFSVIYAVAYKPLPFSRENRIFYIQIKSPQSSDSPASYPEFLDLTRQTRQFSDIAAFNALGSANVGTDSRTVAAPSIEVTDKFFSVLGARTVAGSVSQGFNVDSQTVVLTYSLSRQLFSNIQSAVGSKLRVNGQPYTVAAVLPDDFRFPLNQSNGIYVPLSLTKQRRENRSNYWLFLLAKLRNEVTPQQGETDIKRVFQSFTRTYRDSKSRTADVVPIRTYCVGDASFALKLLFWAVASMLCIGAVNLAGLVLIRNIENSFAFAIRRALGANALHLLRLRLVECVVYTIVGGALGLLIALEVLNLLGPLLTNALIRGSEVRLNSGIILITLTTVLLANLAGTLFPLLSGEVAQLLRSGSRSTHNVSNVRVRSFVVVAQIALATGLVTASGALFSALHTLQNEPLGFDPAHVLTSEVILPQTYKNENVISRFYDPLLRQIQTIPGVQGAAAIQMLPIRASGWNQVVRIVGQPRNGEQAPLAEIRMVTPGIYRAMGQKLLRGRLFDPLRDGTNSPPVVVINEAFVRQIVPPGRDPIGLQIADDEPETIIGVVQDIRQNVYGPALPEMDEVFSQCPISMRTAFLSHMNIVVRTMQNPTSIINEIQAIYRRVDPEVPFREPLLMTQVVSERLTLDQLQTWVLSSFAIAASILSLIGLYASLSYNVTLTRKDLAVRLALGATRNSILWWCYRRVVTMLLMGCTLGLVFAFASRQILYRGGINTTVPLNSIFFSAVFFLLGALAAYGPARRAIESDPATYLRND